MEKEFADKKAFAGGRPTAELLLVVFCVVAVEWIILPFTRNALVIAVPVIILLIVVIFSHVSRGETPQVLGWRFEGFVAALRLLAAPTLIFCGLLVLAGWLADSLRFSEALRWPGFAEKGLKVFVGALLQQHLLQAFFYRRMEETALGAGRTSVFLTALIFALLHLPNLWLTIFTFVGGAVWVRIYQKRQNLLALGLSHWLLSLVLSYSISPDALQGMRVGYNYFRY